MVNGYYTDPRWQLFAEDVTAQTPVRSLVSLPLYREGASMGAPNIHADHSHALR